MPRPTFANDEFYHVFNRGVEKRIIFCERNDYQRFILNLFLFNNRLPVLNSGFHINYWSPTSIIEETERELLVDILCFCLMPNHFHLILRQKVDGGISKFLQKIGTGYTNYFNLKKERSGVLFQGKFKARRVDDDRYLKHLSRYIHLNPLDLKWPKWKDIGIANWSRAQTFLRNYNWSSYQSYLGDDAYSYLLNSKLISELFRGDLGLDYEDFLSSWTQKDLQHDKIIEVGLR